MSGKIGVGLSDLISREDVIAVLCFSQETGQMVCGDLRKLLEEINKVPSAEPERKKGEWIPVESPTVNGKCSECGYESLLYENDVYGEHYCPNCGAWLRMI